MILHTGFIYYHITIVPDDVSFYIYSNESRQTYIFCWVNWRVVVALVRHRRECIPLQRRAANSLSYSCIYPQPLLWHRFHICYPNKPLAAGNIGGRAAIKSFSLPAMGDGLAPGQKCVCAQEILWHNWLEMLRCHI